MPVLSLIIPTRERSEYLYYALESAVGAKSDVEILVSDNASSDDTKSVVESFSDPRIRYINTDFRVSMRQNYEFAVQQSTGDYIIMIGDDDAFVPSAVDNLIGILEAERPQMVRWSPPLYQWPNNAGESNPHLLITKQMMFGGYEKLPTRDLVEAVCNGSLKTQRTMPCIYHGCVARSLMEEIRSRGGHYFGAPTPDVYNSFAGVMVASEYLFIAHPVTIAGASPKSNAGNIALHVNFHAEAKSDPVTDPIAWEGGTTALMYLSTLMAAHRDAGAGAPPINWDGWLSRAMTEARSAYPQDDAYSAFLDSLRSIMKALGHDLPSIAAAPVKVRKKRKKVGRFMSFNRIRPGFAQSSTVLDAVSIVEGVSRKHNITKGIGNTAGRSFKWISLLMRQR